MSTNKGAAQKTYNLKMFNRKEEEIFNDAKKISIFYGRTLRDVIIDELVKFVDRARPDKSVKLVTEAEVLMELQKKGLNTNKALLIKHRQQGNLSGMWWSNEDGRIVYNLMPVVKFFKSRQGRGSGGWLNRNETN